MKNTNYNSDFKIKTEDIKLSSNLNARKLINYTAISNEVFQDYDEIDYSIQRVLDTDGDLDVQFNEEINKTRDEKLFDEFIEKTKANFSSSFKAAFYGALSYGSEKIPGQSIKNGGIPWAYIVKSGLSLESKRESDENKNLAVYTETGVYSVLSTFLWKVQGNMYAERTAGDGISAGVLNFAIDSGASLQVGVTDSIFMDESQYAWEYAKKKWFSDFEVNTWNAIGNGIGQFALPGLGCFIGGPILSFFNQLGKDYIDYVLELMGKPVPQRVDAYEIFIEERNKIISLKLYADIKYNEAMKLYQPGTEEYRNASLEYMVDSAGYGTGKGVVAAAQYLAEYEKVPYYEFGYSNEFGVNTYWGKNIEIQSDDELSIQGDSVTYGLSSSGFISWTLKNAGYDLKITDKKYEGLGQYVTSANSFKELPGVKSYSIEDVKNEKNVMHTGDLVYKSGESGNERIAIVSEINEQTVTIVECNSELGGVKSITFDKETFYNNCQFTEVFDMSGYYDKISTNLVLRPDI